eukprot:gene3550-4475_t
MPGVACDADGGVNLNMAHSDEEAYADLEGALQLKLRAKMIREEQLSPTHPDIASSLNNLAILRKSMLVNVAGMWADVALLLRAEMGKVDEAEDLHRRALTIRQERYPADHPVIATSLNNLALVLNAKAQYEKAQEASSALQAISGTLAEDHPDFPGSLYSEGEMLRVAGKFDAAVSLHERCLALREAKLGADHEAVGQSMDALATLLQSTSPERPRRGQDSITMLKRCLEIRELHFGASHTSVASTLDCLASVLELHGQLHEAKEVAARSVRLGEELGWQEHPSEYEVAQKMLERAITIREKKRGKNHGVDLSMLYGGLAQGKYREAKELYTKAQELLEEVGSGADAETAHILRGLGELFLAQGKYVEAEVALEGALELQESLHGPLDSACNPSLAGAASSLGLLREAQGRLSDAERCHLRALAIQEQVFCEDHLAVADALYRKAGLLKREGKYKEMEPLFERTFEIRSNLLTTKQVYGTHHIAIAEAKFGVAETHRLLARYKKARETYNEVLQIRYKVQGKVHADVALTMYAQGEPLLTCSDQRSCAAAQSRVRYLQV